MGGLGGGLFGGLGLLEILLIAGLAWFAFSWMRRRQATPEPATAGAYGSGYGIGGWQPERSAPSSTATLDPPREVAEANDVERGISHIRQLDAAFDPAVFGETASDIFFKIQAAWVGRDMRRVGDLLTPEMQGILQDQCNRLRGEGRINRLENIAVRRAEVSEAWQERGQDYVTVYLLASVVDYTTDESGRIVDGSATEPVKFEEYWTFVRPAGPNAWKLSAIQQAS
jgi:predicted lipid-binding transport protein (Tim44 family)